MKLDSMLELYISELQDMYNGEQQLIKALPKMAKSASSGPLGDAFNSHLAETKQQAERLEQIFEALERKPGGETCEAMKGLITEGEEIIKAGKNEAVRDAGLIVAAQKVEHYEIATYGCLVTFARLLGRDDDARLLKQTLDEEKACDTSLTSLAESEINVEAANA
jgi:ferritin-like metal-binding protein YciE